VVTLVPRLGGGVCTPQNNFYIKTRLVTILKNSKANLNQDEEPK